MTWMTDHLHIWWQPSHTQKRTSYHIGDGSKVTHIFYQITRHCLRQHLWRQWHENGLCERAWLGFRIFCPPFDEIKSILLKSLNFKFITLWHMLDQGFGRSVTTPCRYKTQQHSPGCSLLSWACDGGGGQQNKRPQAFQSRRDKRKQDKTRQDKTRQDKTRQDKTRQGKTRQDKTRQDKTRRDKTRQDKTRQDKIRYDKTGQDKTRQDKSRQDKTRPHSSFHVWDHKPVGLGCNFRYSAFDTESPPRWGIGSALEPGYRLGLGWG
jgi:hypothetical protein